MFMHIDVLARVSQQGRMAGLALLFSADTKEDHKSTSSTDWVFILAQFATAFAISSSGVFLMVNSKQTN